MFKVNALQVRTGLIVLDCIGVFKISASHIYSVALEYGNSRSDAVFYPAAIDILILVSALTLIAKRGVNRTVKIYAKLGRYFGFAATIFANVVHGNFGMTTGAVVNLIPAISLIIVMELAIHSAHCKPGTVSRKP